MEAPLPDRLAPDVPEDVTVDEAEDHPAEDDPAEDEAPEDDPVEDEEPVAAYDIVAVEPAEVTLELANRLVALDRAELVAARRDLALLSGRGLLAQLQAREGGLWVAGPRERPLTRPLGWAMLSIAGGGARLHGSVAREQRANGIGGALLTEALGRADAEGHSLVTATVWSASEAEEFLWRHGFRESGTPTTMRRLEVLATKARRSRIVEDAQTYATAYQLLREVEETDDPGGGTLFRVRSRHRITGAMAGTAELTVLDGAPEHALRGGLSVAPEHRGNRLGVLMLGDLLHWIETDHPKVRAAQSPVPANSTHVIAVLDRLGCRIAGVQVELRRILR